MRYTPRERPDSSQRLRWRLGEESRGSFCSLVAASIFSSYDAVVLLALERRKGDGIDAFFREAALAGYAYEVLRAVDGVMIVEMARRPAK